MLGLLATVMLVATLPLPVAAQCYSWPIESVYDGDTLRATVAGKSTPIRIMGLDTPELPPRSRCEYEKSLGYAARDRLRTLLGNSLVSICPEGVDKYRRTLARILVDGRDVAEVLIGEGLAREYHGGRRAGWCE
jgi:endonuclease YncB( thermonuclease family)